mgnify:CR=1 FL=1
MNSDDIIDLLNNLVQLDIDAIQAYDQAIQHIKETEIKQKLIEFQHDHQRHVFELSKEIKELGGIPPKDTDIKGFFLESFTALRGLLGGTSAALKAMRSNEELTNKTYKEALDQSLPLNIKSLIEKNYLDERKHLAYIDHKLSMEEEG